MRVKLLYIIVIIIGTRLISIVSSFGNRYNIKLVFKTNPANVLPTNLLYSRDISMYSITVKFNS
jgi:hypothetical protein